MDCIYRDNTLNAVRESAPITLVPLMGQVYMLHVYHTSQGEGPLPVLMCLKCYSLAELE